MHELAWYLWSIALRRHDAARSEIIHAWSSALLLTAIVDNQYGSGVNDRLGTEWGKKP